MFELLFKSLSQFVYFTAKEEQLIADQFIYREVPNQFSLVAYEGICKELYFLNKGCVRLYYLKDGEELTGFLFTEGLFFNSFESFLLETPSIQILETVEPCELLVISKPKIEELYKTVPKTNVFFRKLLEARFINAQRLVATFVLDKPEERYLGMLASNPELLNRFPQHMLATFLGITPVSLSRIRKRIADRK